MARIAVGLILLLSTVRANSPLTVGLVHVPFSPIALTLSPTPNKLSDGEAESVRSAAEGLLTDYFGDKTYERGTSFDSIELAGVKSNVLTAASSSRPGGDQRRGAIRGRLLDGDADEYEREETRDGNNDPPSEVTVTVEVQSGTTVLVLNGGVACFELSPEAHEDVSSGRTMPAAYVPSEEKVEGYIWMGLTDGLVQRLRDELGRGGGGGGGLQYLREVTVGLTGGTQQHQQDGKYAAGAEEEGDGAPEPELEPNPAGGAQQASDEPGVDAPGAASSENSSAREADSDVAPGAEPGEGELANAADVPSEGERAEAGAADEVTSEGLEPPVRSSPPYTPGSNQNPAVSSILNTPQLADSDSSNRRIVVGFAMIMGGVLAVVFAFVGVKLDRARKRRRMEARMREAFGDEESDAECEEGVEVRWEDGEARPIGRSWSYDVGEEAEGDGDGLEKWAERSCAGWGIVA